MTTIAHEKMVVYFELPGILPDGSVFVVNRVVCTCLVLSSSEGHCSLDHEVLFSPQEIELLLLLLENYPDYCPLEVLLAAIKGGTIEQARERLYAAFEGGYGEDVSAPVRNRVYYLRQRLKPMDIEIETIMTIGHQLKRKRNRP